ncbi:MAG: hypothetical protein P8103_06075 [Candidatus Thiodiazotropha sp.]
MRQRFQVDPCRSHVALWIRAVGETLQPERALARTFLSRLDREAEAFSFRTFSDAAYTRLAGYDPLERAIHGALDDCWQELQELNRAGAAIAVTINQTNGLARREEDIRRVRALFLDDDRGIEPDHFSLRPHMRVTTSHGHNHYYWLVNGLELADYSGWQRRLADRYGGDRRVLALNQAMQLPGFWRRKRMIRPLMPGLQILNDGPCYRLPQLRNLLQQPQPA